MKAMWAERDAAVVWHGFTDMSTYLDHCPVVVERAEGHELIDTEGRRYLDAISSLWVNTMGHRVPELDQAVRDQLDLVAHSTMLGNGNRVVVELAEALAAVVPVVDPHFMFSSDGASAVEQALKLAFQFWRPGRRAGPDDVPGLRRRLPRRHRGSLSLGADDGFGASLFSPLRFPVLRAPGYDDPACFEVACRMVDERAGRLAAVVVEPLVQGAAGMRMADPAGFAALAAALPGGRRAAHPRRGGGRVRPHRHPLRHRAVRSGVRPDLLCLGKGITGGYLPLAVTVAGGRVFEAFAARPSPTGTPTGAMHWPRRWPCATCGCSPNATCWPTCRRARPSSPLLAERVATLAGVYGIRVKGLLCGVDVEAGAGRDVCDLAVAAGVLLRPIGDTVIVVPPLTITAGEVERIVEVLAGAVRARLG